VRFWKILGQSANFDVSRLTDHDREITCGDEAFEMLMGVSHERTGSIHDVVSGRSPLLPIPVRSAVRCDHDPAGIGIGRVK
jgi:hypothetical protein